MFGTYLAAIIGLRQTRDLARSALPDAPVRPDPKRSDTGGDRH